MLVKTRGCWACPPFTPMIKWLLMSYFPIMKMTALQLLEGYRVQRVCQWRWWQGILTDNNQQKTRQHEGGGNRKEVQPGGSVEEVHKGIMVTKMAQRVSYSQRAALRVWCSKCDANSSGYKKNNNRWSSVSSTCNFGQQRLNGAVDWSATKGGRVLPHFEHIVSGTSMPPCPITAVI